MSVYYNEIDPYAAAWLRNLIAARHIADGEVDERSILDVRPSELRSFDQCHFFAGIGGWSYALRLAGWPDDRPVWTGSCPCQPFSAAGKQRGSDDERHLWPAFFDLIRECRPGSVFGEQVAGAAGLAWLDHVCADLEGAGYAAAAAALPACCVGAHHKRERLFWVAHDDRAGLGERAQRHGAPFHGKPLEASRRHHADGRRELCNLADPAPGGQRIDGSAPGQAGHVALGDATCAMAHADRASASRHGEHGRAVQAESGIRCGLGDRSVLGNAAEPRPQGRDEPRQRADAQRATAERAGSLDAWADLAWIECSDGKARPTQPGLFPLAHGVSNRVGRLRAYGNAIVPQVAAAFVMAAAAP